ncbi:MAG: RluA family pseudouridine synthase [Calditrichaeota bacterium]|nr:RluA family pseudouridine synthase [Calditrichota bacterium]
MTEEKLTLIVDNEDIGYRLDVYLTNRFKEHSRSYFYRLIKNRYVLVNNEPAKSGYILRKGDEITVHFKEVDIDLQPAPIPIDIVYEDDDIIVINKPAGMVVHPGKGNESNTLVNALLHYTSRLADTGEAVRPGIVHRLDKDTSGLIIIAKNDLAQRKLRRQFDTKEIFRIYWALVWGDFAEEKDTIRASIARSRKNPIKFVVDERGRHAITHYRVLKRFRYVTLIEVKLETGRTHQIRVHMTHIHHPVVGDQLYNGRETQLLNLPDNLRKRGLHLLKLLPYQTLHAKKLIFLHPRTGEKMEFESDLPENFRLALQKLPDLFMLDEPEE